MLGIPDPDLSWAEFMSLPEVEYSPARITIQTYKRRVKRDLRAWLKEERSND